MCVCFCVTLCFLYFLQSAWITMWFRYPERTNKYMYIQIRRGLHQKDILLLIVVWEIYFPYSIARGLNRCRVKGARVQERFSLYPRNVEPASLCIALWRRAHAPSSLWFSPRPRPASASSWHYPAKAYLVKAYWTVLY